MNTHKRTFFLVLSLLVVSVIMAAPAWAQTNTNPSGNPEVKYGVYDVNQEIEFGGRVVSTTGNKSIWSTFVNQDSGARIFSENLEMHAPLHNGLLFDDLSLNSFGFGGDPNSVARLKVLKGKWYTFQASFRRDKAFFDYNLLANTTNLPSNAPNVQYTISPHLSDLVRKMQDYNLNLFPVSRFRVRLGYSFATQTGRTFNSSHFGTEPSYTRPWKTNNQTYRAGFTYELVKGTNLTFDHSFAHFKNDTSALDEHQLFTLNGRPLDLGLPFAPFAPYNAPCANAYVGGVVNPVCNGYYAYTQFAPMRSDIPTDSLGFTSNWKRLNQTGRVFYSGGDVWVPTFNEFLDGMTTRTNQRIASTTGNMFNRRVSSGADYAATFRISDHLSLVESFRWDAYRIPSGYAYNSSSLFGTSLTATPTVFDPALCPAPYTAATCPQHVSSSGADVTRALSGSFEGDDLKSNLVSLEFNLNRQFGGHAGFKYETRKITLRAYDLSTLTYYPGGRITGVSNAALRGSCAAKPWLLNAQGVCTVDTASFAEEEYKPETKGAIFGFWFRPNDNFRISFDSEVAKTDNPFTVISPRNFQLYRIKSSFRPKEWVSVAAGASVLKRANDEVVDNKNHTYAVSFDTSLNPNGKLGADFGYQYTDVFSNSNICYWSTPNVLGSQSCAANPVANLYQAVSFYTNTGHFGYFNVVFKPTSRFRGALGYSANRTDGNSLLTGQFMSQGPLDSIYHMPSASFELDLNQSLTWKTAWNYYGYEEGSYQPAGVTLPRDARGNVFTLSLRYKIGGAR